MNNKAARERRKQKIAEVAHLETVEPASKPAKNDIRLFDVIRYKRPAEALPDPWLFDTEELLKELDRCRELILHVPAPTNETHFALNIAIDALWNLRDHLRYMLSLHRDMQRSFAAKAEELKNPVRQANPDSLRIKA
jgi:hypothetical protein